LCNNKESTINNNIVKTLKHGYTRLELRFTDIRT
jgi:hypothetical protein